MNTPAPAALRPLPTLAALVLALLLAGCGREASPPEAARPAAEEEPDTMTAALPDATPLGAVRITRHEGDDDLLSGGLGLAGLRAQMPPAAANPLAPTPAELRRMAMHANWRGIADLTPGGGVEAVMPELPLVHGEEFSALLVLPGRNAPHRVVLQLPDDFDAERPCVVVAPASGSRGVYGAIAVAGPWALPRGCALVMTDKGAGTDLFDPATSTGTALDGSRAMLGGGAPLAFVPPGFDAAALAPDEKRLALRHAHSMDNPEADWGGHALQALRFALDRIGEKLGRELDADSVRVIAVGVSNGGGAVLRAAEHEAGGWIDAVVAGEPNIQPAGTRSLYDLSTEAALLQPCAMLDPALADAPFNSEALRAAGALRCRALAEAGLLQGEDDAALAADALARLRAGGWEDGALRSAVLSAAFDLWRAVAATYASAYSRSPWDAMPCGYGVVTPGPDGQPMPAPALVLSLWWAMGSGIPPALGVGLHDSLAETASGSDKALPGLLCLRALLDGEDEAALALQKGLSEIVSPAAPKSPVLIVHGRDDGLVPAALTARPWAAAALANGAELRYHELDHGQHFDAFLAVPAMAASYVPLLPYVWQLLDQAEAMLDGGPAPMPSQRIRATPRGAGEALGPAQLDGLRQDPGSDAIVLEDGALKVPATSGTP